jgi:hypothetical protein
MSTRRKRSRFRLVAFNVLIFSRKGDMLGILAFFACSFTNMHNANQKFINQIVGLGAKSQMSTKTGCIFVYIDIFKVSMKQVNAKFHICI